MIKKIKNLETNRLILEKLDTKFLSHDYVNWLNDPEVNKYMETKGSYTIHKLKRFLNEVENKNIYFWAILIKETKKHIGNIKIDPINELYGNGEYGILIGDKISWGNGYAKEATKKILDYCFGEEVNLRKITLGVVKENKAAIKLYNSLGFTQEGLYKNHSFHNNKWCDVIRMAIFNDKYVQEFR